VQSAFERTLAVVFTKAYQQKRLNNIASGFPRFPTRFEGQKDRKEIEGGPSKQTHLSLSPAGASLFV
jgi:hypothetical protein